MPLPAGPCRLGDPSKPAGDERYPRIDIVGRHCGGIPVAPAELLAATTVTNCAMSLDSSRFDPKGICSYGPAEGGLAATTVTATAITVSATNSMNQADAIQWRA
jgi:hypothetical protein